MSNFSGRLHASRCRGRGWGVEGGQSAPPAPSQEEIARLAYSYWEARGRQGGSAEADWLRAERELQAPDSGSEVR